MATLEDPAGLFGGTPRRFQSSGVPVVHDLSAVALLLVPPLAWPQNGVVMSMQPRPWPDVPELTAKMARSSSRRGNLAMRIRDELGEVYADARFAGAFGVRGRPGISPGQLMMASVLQFSENLTDRQAAEAVRDRMTWKYALGLELDDPGFDASVLSEFRSRLVAGDLTCLALDALLERLAGLGLVKAGGRQRTDSTHVLGEIRSLNRLELAGESGSVSSTSLSSRLAPTCTGAGCTRRCSTGKRPARRSSDVCSRNSPASGRQPRRSCSRRRSHRCRARGHGSNRPSSPAWSGS